MASSTASLELLLGSALNINQVEHGNNSLLHHIFTYIDQDDALQPRIRLFVSHGLHVNKRNDSGRTAMATLVCNAEDTSTACGLLQCLLSCGADPSIADCTGWTPLHYALMFEKPRLLRILLHHDTTLAEAVTFQNTDVLALAAYGSISIVLTLLDAQIDVACDVTDNWGRTPRENAAIRYQRPDVWRRLMLRWTLWCKHVSSLTDNPEKFHKLFNRLLDDIIRRRRKRQTAEAATASDGRDTWRAARFMLDGELLLAYQENKERVVPGSFPID